MTSVQWPNSSNRIAAFSQKKTLRFHHHSIRNDGTWLRNLTNSATTRPGHGFCVLYHQAATGHLTLHWWRKKNKHSVQGGCVDWHEGGRRLHAGIHKKKT